MAVLQVQISLAQITSFRQLLVLRHGAAILQLNLQWKIHYTPVMITYLLEDIAIKPLLKQHSQVMVKSLLWRGILQPVVS